MGTPAEHLPPRLSTQSVAELTRALGLPVPAEVEPLSVTAEYHSIYLLHYRGKSANEIPARAELDGSLTLVLRVSGRHIPRVKTMNEVGIMTWIRQNTTIPVPSVVRFSESEDNPIGYEFTLLEKAPGTSLDKVYGTLDENARKGIVEQLVGYLMQLHSKPWIPGFVGGLVLKGGVVTPGPALEETFWQLPEVEKYWPGETIASLNPLNGPFQSWTAYVTAAVSCYVYAIESHPSLSPFRDMLPNIRSFLSAINSPRYKPELDDVNYVLAHKDLHFANIMCDVTSPGAPITAVLDWEFSGIVPAPRWNPARAFLWNGVKSPEAKEEKERLEKIFQTICVEKRAEFLLEDVKLNELQEFMMTAVNHIRAIVEVCPRGQAQDSVGKWKGIAEAAMEAFS